MATETLQIRITAELAQIRAALTGLQGQLDKAKATGASVGSGSAQGIAQLNNRLATTARVVAGIAASIGAGMSIAGLVAASDEAATIAAKLRLASKDAQSFALAQRAVFDIAQRTRTSLLATVDLYARIERSTREIGLNQATLLQLTETINQAAQISGGGPGTEAALFQLSQGLASGTLRGEELNSVLEQTPRLAQAIADGMNIPLGKLRALAKDGELTSQAVLRAVLSQSKGIQEEFANFPPTIASGFTAIRNALVQYLTTSTQAQTAARSFAEALMTIARNLPAILDGLIRLGPIVAGVYAAFKLWPLIAGAVGLATAAVANFQRQLLLTTPAMAAAATQGRVLAGSMAAMGPASAIGATGAVRALGWIKGGLGVLIAAFAGWQIGKYLSDQFLQVRLAGVALVVGILKLWERIKGITRALGVAMRETFAQNFNLILDLASSFYEKLAQGAANIPGVGGKLSGFYKGIASNIREGKVEAEGLADAMARVSMETNDAVDAIERQGSDLADALIEIDAANKPGVTGPTGEVGVPGTGDTGDAGKAAKLAAQLAAAEAGLVADRVRRAIEQIQRLYDDHELSIRDFYAEKQRLELEGIDAAIAAAQAERAAAKDAGEVADANAKIVMLLRDRAEIGPRAAREQAAAEKELTRELGALQIRMLQAQGETAEATRLQLEQEFEDLLKRLKAEGDTAGVALAKRVINVEAFRAELDQVDAKVREALSRFDSVQSSTGAQVEAGMLGQSDAEDRVAEQRAASLAVLTDMRDRYAEVAANARLANDVMSETRALEAITQIDGQIAQLSINTESLGYKASQVLKGALTTLFEDLASGSKSAGEALRDFVLNFVRGMAQIAAQALATFLVLKLLDAIYPGLGKLTASMASGGVHHSGGVVGAGGTPASFPALLFAGAPRMHTGGVAGLGPDEVPIVAKRGEEVLNRMDPRHRNNGGLEPAAQRGNQRFIFIDDERRVADYLSSPESDEVFVQKISRNAGAVRELVR